MAATPENLAVIARGGKSDIPVGPMCHDTVLGWLEESGYVPDDAHATLFLTGEDEVQCRTDVYARIFVNQEDTHVIDVDTLKDLPAGTIIGFYKENLYMHTIIACGDQIFAGSNNGGIINPDEQFRINYNDFMLMQTKQIKFNTDGTWGMDGYKMYAAAPDVIAQRVKDALRVEP